MKIIIIDQFPILRSGLTFLMRQNFKEAEIIQSSCVRTFLEKYPVSQASLILLGTGPDPNCNTFLPVDLTETRKPPVVLLYEQAPNAELMKHYRDAGVKGFISKKQGSEDLLECINRVMVGKNYTDNELRTYLTNTGTPLTQKSEFLIR